MDIVPRKNVNMLRVITICGCNINNRENNGHVDVAKELISYFRYSVEPKKSQNPFEIYLCFICGQTSARRRAKASHCDLLDFPCLQVLIKSTLSGLNRGPSDYESGTLPLS